MFPEGGGDELAGVLRAFARDPEARSALGVEARRRVLAEYTDESIAQRTLAFWRAVTGSANP